MVEEFKFTHTQIGQKVGKSREYVSNTLRLLALPQEILDALSAGRISEGHTRPILMLSDRPAEQMVLFKEIVFKKMSVREAERIARRIAYDKVRKKEYIPDPEIAEMEEKLGETLGTRVHIEKKENGGYITIDFFTKEDLHTILDIVKLSKSKNPNEMLENFIAKEEEKNPIVSENFKKEEEVVNTEEDRTKEEIKKAEEEADLYNIKNFSV